MRYRFFVVQILNTLYMALADKRACDKHTQACSNGDSAPKLFLRLPKVCCAQAKCVLKI